MKFLTIGMSVAIAGSMVSFANASTEVITLACKPEAPFTSKFEGVVQVSKLATSSEPVSENEVGSAKVSLSRLETEVLPDGTARQIEIMDQIDEASFAASSEFLPAGALFVHDATIVTLSSSELKASIRIILEKSGANSTVVFDGARYSANCQID
ncbi:MAG: hypothetical protein U1E10_11410 [Bdellovibrionales bacterium]|nr:hypothetical protein [Bdellovibrionales bacterium]